MQKLESMLKDLDFPLDAIKKLERWDRVRAIREHATWGGDPDLSKFSRNTKKCKDDILKDYRKKCTEINERQIKMLGSTSTDFQVALTSKFLWIPAIHVILKIFKCQSETF